MLTAAWLGFTVGFVFSMPVAGPISILVFGRGLQDRIRSGVYLALGGALAESVYAYLAFWGFSELLTVHPWVQPISRGVAAVLLIGLGLHFMLKRSRGDAPEVPPDPAVGNKRSFFLGFTITALNPTLIATWGAAVAAVHSWELVSFDSNRALPFSIGVCLGISAWFVILLWLLRRFRGRFRRSTLDMMIRVMGVALAILGLVFAWRFAVYVRDLA
jgi:threonine/homoserine/homoserine lactone efflux protein